MKKKTVKLPAKEVPEIKKERKKRIYKFHKFRTPAVVDKRPSLEEETFKRMRILFNDIYLND